MKLKPRSITLLPLFLGVEMPTGVRSQVEEITTAIRRRRGAMVIRDRLPQVGNYVYLAKIEEPPESSS